MLAYICYICVIIYIYFIYVCMCVYNVYSNCSSATGYPTEGVSAAQSPEGEVLGSQAGQKYRVNNCSVRASSKAAPNLFLLPHLPLAGPCVPKGYKLSPYPSPSTRLLFVLIPLLLSPTLFAPPS